MRYFVLFLLLVVPGLQAGERPLRIVTLSTVLTEIAREVGGAEVTVKGLVKPGVDPHAFDPSAADIRALAEADLVLASGLSLEGYLDRLAANTGGKARVLKVGDALPAPALDAGAAAHAHADDDDHAHAGERDPHWWHGIDQVFQAAERVRTEYTRLRPAAADAFARNTRAYQTRLLELKAWTARSLAVLPPGRRHLLTSHDAFGYFAHENGFIVHAVSGLSTDSEPDAKHVASLVELIRREQIRALFTENSASSRVIQNLVRETGVKLGGTLYADGLGPAGSGAETYEAMYRHNVTTLVEALR